jgi:hypothetical protein
MSSLPHQDGHVPNAAETAGKTNKFSPTSDYTDPVYLRKEKRA